MQLQPCTDFDDAHLKIIWGGSLAAASLSLFGSSFMLTSMLILGKGSRFSRLLACLAWTNYFWSVSVIVPTALSMGGSPLDEVGCILFRGFFQIFSGSSMCWTLCVAIYMNMVSKKNKTFSRKKKIDIFFLFIFSLLLLCKRSCNKGRLKKC